MPTIATLMNQYAGGSYEVENYLKATKIQLQGLLPTGQKVLSPPHFTHSQS